VALTAERLVVIGRGRLITDTTVEEFVARAGGSAVTVSTPQAARLRELRPTRQLPGCRRDGWLRRSGSS
jgi:ABC-2 type transport system ATP-binding protein